MEKRQQIAENTKEANMNKKQMLGHEMAAG